MAEDTFRKTFAPLNDGQKQQMQAIKEKADELLNLFPKQEDRSERSRCAALAKTKLEEAVMWAVKGVTSSE